MYVLFSCHITNFKSVKLYTNVIYTSVNRKVKIIEPEAGPPFTRYNLSLHNALL